MEVKRCRSMEVWKRVIAPRTRMIDSYIHIFLGTASAMGRRKDPTMCTGPYG